MPPSDLVRENHGQQIKPIQQYHWFDFWYFLDDLKLESRLSNSLWSCIILGKAPCARGLWMIHFYPLDPQTASVVDFFHLLKVHKLPVIVAQLSDLWIHWRLWGRKIVIESIQQYLCFSFHHFWDGLKWESRFSNSLWSCTLLGKALCAPRLVIVSFQSHFVPRRRQGMACANRPWHF